MGSSLCRECAYFLSIGLFALLPMVEALSCNSYDFDERDICEEILGSDASESDKSYLIANIRNSNPTVANHSFVDGWNREIIFGSHPYEVQSEDEGIIRDAWLRIISLSPSVIHEGKLLTSGIGYVQTAYNYRIELPTQNEGDDCKADYSLEYSNPQLSVLLNGQQIGTTSYVPFSGSGNLEFEARLSISARMKVVHYENVRYCCRRSSGGGCLRYCFRCQLDGTEYRNYNLNLEDSKNAISDWRVISPSIKAIDSYQDTIHGIVNISNQNSVRFYVGDSSFEQSRFIFEYNSSLAPFDVLTLRAIPSYHKSSKNMIIEENIEGFLFSVPSSTSCDIEYSDFFHTWNQECNLEITSPEPKISTDKFSYSENETILIDLEPKNTAILVKYGDQEKVAINSAIFVADSKNNAIVASIDGRKAETYIHVEHKDVAKFLLNAGVFGGILYCYWLFIRKVWGI